MGRCFRRGGAGTGVRESRGRYTEVRPLVRWREESCALKTEREGKEAGCQCLAAAGLWVGGAHAILRDAKRHLCRQ